MHDKDLITQSDLSFSRRFLSAWRWISGNGKPSVRDNCHGREGCAANSEPESILIPARSLGTVETRHERIVELPRKLELQCGASLSPVTVAYETYGALNGERSNAILVCHALSGDAHAAGYHEGQDSPGWWDTMIGPGKPIDTDRYFVICSNVLGGCKGTTGPSSINPDTGQPYSLEFPVITIRDMVEVQRLLVDHLGIDQLLSVVGGSMGGMQVLQWVSSYPERIRSAIPVAAALKHSPQQIAFNEVVRQSIMADPDWQEGRYYEKGQPGRGLSVARMIGHITYMSDRSMEQKFSRRLKNGSLSFRFTEDFEVEGYLRYRGDSFVRRFDANTYLYITKAMDYCDLSDELPSADRGSHIRYLVLSFTSDWLYPAEQSLDIVRRLKTTGADVTYCNIESDYGHDAFLVESDEQAHLVGHFLDTTFERLG